MAKKLFFGLLGAFVLLLGFYAVYNLKYRNNTTVATVPGAEKTSTLEKIGDVFDKPASEIQFVLGERTLGAIATDDGHLSYYSVDEAALRRATADGKDKETLLSNLPGEPTRILWSPNREKLLLNLKMPDGRTLWHTATIATKTLTPLKSSISRLVWDNTGTKILYAFAPEGGKKSLDMADPDGTNWKTLIPLEEDKDFFFAPIPQSGRVAYWSQPNAFQKTLLRSTTLTGEAPKILLSDRNGADYNFSPDGRRILVSAAKPGSQGDANLFVMNENGGEIRALNASTLIQKTVWSPDGKTIYYAIAAELPENTILPNEYFEKGLHSRDTFWKMDIATGKAKRIVETDKMGGTSYDATDLFLSPKEDYLYFRDRESGKVYRIEL